MTQTQTQTQTQAQAQASAPPDQSLTDADETNDGIISVRCGHGANCSSIGSAVEMLFLSATVGAAILAAVAAALSPDAEASQRTPSTARAEVDAEAAQTPEKSPEK